MNSIFTTGGAGFTLVDILKAQSGSKDTGITFIEEGGQEEFLSYHDLYLSALCGLYVLQQAGISPGQELVFQIEENKSFLIAFWACILGGIIPVPLTAGRNDEHQMKLFRVWKVLQHPFLIVSRLHLDKLGHFAERQRLEEVFGAIEKRYIDETLLVSSSRPGTPIAPSPDDIAFIQFSSGSTGDPNGVVLTHANLLANIRAISLASAYTANDTMLSWMPLTHDMGLIGFHISPLFNGIHHYLMPVNLFVRRPALWLGKATDHRITILCSPNFGYGYVLRHCRPQQQRYHWDLSSVRLIYNGAEPIWQKICREFLEVLAPFGLSVRCMCPVYGLAEASLAVSISVLGEDIHCVWLHRDHLKTGDRIAEAAPEENAISFISVGRPIDACSVRIADDADEPLGSGYIGHIQIQGASVTAGYYRQPDKTRVSLTDDRWFRTGDLGFIEKGALYITGRSKEIFFVNGQNFYPHDIERIIVEAELAELNKVVVAGWYNSQGGRDEAVAFVFHRGSAESFLPTERAIQDRVLRGAGIELHRILPVKDIPRTTSGKLQRHRLVQQLQEGVFGSTAQAPDIVDTGGAEIEQRLQHIWSVLLRRSGIGREDHFISLGGTSLKAAELCMLIEQAYGVALPVETVYRHPVLRELAGVLRDLRVGEVRVNEPDVTHVLTGDSFIPVSAAQRRIYYAWEANPGSIAYNLPIAVQWQGTLDVDRLCDCLQGLVRRHDSWRSVFRCLDGPEFRVGPEAPVELFCEEVEPGVLDERMRSLVYPFDLKKGHLYRFALLRSGGRTIFFADFHHIVSDGISLFHFLQELEDVYHGYPLPVLPIRYADHVRRERDRQSMPMLEEHRTFWRAQLTDDWPLLDLPTDKQRPVVFDTAGGKIGFDPGDELVLSLRRLAGQLDCTLHVLLLTAYQLFLSKYTGERDVAVGIPVSGRRHPDLLHLQGMFVNNLPIRCRWQPEESFMILAGRVKDAVAAALTHQDLYFDEVVGLLRGPRDIGRNPVFDTMFLYQNMGRISGVRPVAGDEISGWVGRPLSFDPGFAKFDLSLEVIDDGECLSAGFEYSTHLFEPATIRRMAQHFIHLLDAVVRTPDRPVSILSLLGPEESGLLVHSFNDTTRRYPSTTVIALFLAQVQRDPDAISLEEGEMTVSYRQLNEAVEQLAGRLRQEGVGPGSLVALLLPPSVPLITAILAVFMTGAAYLPIEPGLPEERIRYLLDDSRCRLLIAEDGEGGIDLRSAGIMGSQEEDAGISDKLAYIIYTSGTTGSPKGVMVGQTSLVNYLLWAAETYLEGEPARFPLFTSVAFDLTVTSLFLPLITGNRIVLYNGRPGEVQLEKVIADNKVDILKLTPSHLWLLNGMELPVEGSRIRKLIVGGEQLDTALACSIVQRFGGRVTIYNEYGPTEATVGCMIHVYSEADTTPGVPIGRPIANTRIYLLDGALSPVPAGVSGEIFIAGKCLATGYLHRKDLTGERFISDPLFPGEKMYRTGDKARRLAGGELEYLGRLDRQVKINGYRIELTEIEQQMAKLPGVAQAIVTVMINSRGRKMLCSYYIRETSMEVETPAGWKEALSKRLPHYMIPAYIIEVGSVPLTRNGKIDYQALPLPGEAEDADGPDDEGCLLYMEGGSRGVIESRMLAAWTEVLGTQRLSRTDNFFELGGDSISAVQIVSRLAGEGIAVSVRDILTYHTIEQIGLHAVFADPGGRYEQGTLSGYKELSPIETWFFRQALVNPSHYNQSILLRLNKKVDQRLLARAFSALIAFHDGLRLNYDTGARGLFYNDRHLEKEFVLGRLSSPAGGSAALSADWDLGSSLLLAAALIGEEDNVCDLFITAHHLVMDGFSWRILLGDLRAVYECLETGREMHFPHKTASLTQWQAALTDYACRFTPADERYWSQAEKGVVPLPRNLAASDGKVDDAGRLTAQLDPQHTAALIQGAYEVYKADVYLLLNAALVMTLHEWTGLDRFVVEQEDHGRRLDEVDVSRTIGWFTVLYPLVLTWQDGLPDVLIRGVRTAMAEAPDRGLMYFSQRYRQAAHAADRPAPVELRFNYLGHFGEEMDNELFTCLQVPTGNDGDPANGLTAHLEINAMILRSVLHIEFIYNRRAYDIATLASIRDRYLKNILLLSGDPAGSSLLHLTPADFDAIDLNQQELDALFR